MSARLLAALDTVLGRTVTGRNAAADFGPPPAVRYAKELDRYTDLELIRRDRAELLAEIRASRRRKVGAR